MSGLGSPIIELDASGMQIALIAASWHDQVMDGLIAGALRAADQMGAVAQVWRVPGSFELPLIAQQAALSGKFEAVVALGVIIRGGTPHFEYVSSAATDGLNRVALDTNVPVGFGLLTCDDEAQALDRAGLTDSREDKGAEATMAAVSAALVLRDLRSL
ncbi:MAG: 6,7-dimethyl-8-ribityllumazine synthase [Candidatus Nanopelagicales bacterium]|jgi:6,7-dimethyl-8-ribityllumazine synthase|nr:6,7-dimethyl-8-ribityllumazine synthase [Candidatus Nanopelagicales bacterium]